MENRQQSSVRTILSMIKEHRYSNHETIDGSVIAATPPFYVIKIDGIPYPVPRVESINPSMVFDAGDRITLLIPRGDNYKIEIVGFATSDIPEEEAEVNIREAEGDPVLFITSGDADTNFYAYDAEGNEIASRGFSLDFADGAGVALDGSNYFISDTYGGRVCKYDLDGNLISSWSGYGTYPWGVAVNDEYVYVNYVLSYMTELKRFDKNGNYLSSGPLWSLPRGVCTDGVNVFGAYGAGIRKFTKELVFVKTKSTGTTNIAIVTDRVGYIYYSEYGNGKPIRKMDTGLNSIVATSSETIDMSETMAIDEDGNIYVGNHVGLVKVFDANLNYLRNFTINPTRGMCGNYLL